MGAAIVLLAYGVARAAPPFSGGAQIFDCAGNPRCIEGADIDGDGWQDLVVLTSADLVVLRGHGDGSFEAPVAQATGIGPVTDVSLLTLADVNADGRSDAVLVHRFGMRVAILLGQSSASFAPPLFLDTGAALGGVAVARMDGDAWPDLAAATISPSGVLVFPGRGDGSFGTGVAVTDAGPNVVGIATGDLDGDGNADLVVSRFRDGLSVLRGQGDGTFAPRADYGVGLYGDRLAIGDVNGDGRGDVISAVGSQIHILTGNGDGTLAVPVTLSGGPNLTGLSLGDLNGDGRTDIATSNDHDEHHNDDASRVWLFTSSAAWAFDRMDLRITHDPQAVAIADLDGDGRGDVVIGNASSNVSVLLASQQGLPIPRSFSTGWRPLHIDIADLDADGYPDLVTANLLENSVSVLRGLGGGRFAARQDFLTGFGPLSLGIGDVDGDARLDVVAAGRDANTISVLLGRGDGTLRTNTDFGTGGSPGGIVLADADADGRLDAIVTVPSGVAVLGGLGEGFFAPPVTAPVNGNPSRLTSGDLDADGDIDVVATRSSANDVVVLLGNGDRTFGPPRSFAVGSAPTSIARGDLNADGRIDLAVTHGLGISLLYGNGDGTFQPRREMVLQYANAAAIHDLNGDGRADLVIANWRFVHIYFAVEDGSFSAPLIVGAGLSSYAVAIADLDGDRRPDVAVTNSVSNTVTVLRNEIVPVPVLVEALSSHATERGVRLTWRLSDPRPWRGIDVERAAAATGPYFRLHDAPLEASAMQFEDADAPATGAWYRLVLHADDGRAFVAGPVHGVGVAFVGVRLDAPRAEVSQVRFGFALGAARAHVQLDVFDTRGTRVRRLVAGHRDAGEHVVFWDRRDTSGARVARGVYLVHLQTSAGRATRKLVLVP